MGRYTNIPILKNLGEKSRYTNKQLRATTKYPLIPNRSTDIYVITDVGDSLSSLANSFYNDQSLWWIISAANVGLPQDSLYIEAGTQLRIPIEVNLIIDNFNEKNNVV